MMKGIEYTQYAAPDVFQLQDVLQTATIVSYVR